MRFEKRSRRLTRIGGAQDRADDGSARGAGCEHIGVGGWRDAADADYRDTGQFDPAPEAVEPDRRAGVVLGGSSDYRADPEVIGTSNSRVLCLLIGFRRVSN